MALNSVSQTNWNVTNLQPNTKYYFVIAYVFNTVREYSEMQSVTTPGNIANSNVIPLPEEIHPPNTIPPNPPEGLNLTNGKTYYFRSRAKDVNGLWEDYPQWKKK